MMPERVRLQYEAALRNPSSVSVGPLGFLLEV